MIILTYEKRHIEKLLLTTANEKLSMKKRIIAGALLLARGEPLFHKNRGSLDYENCERFMYRHRLLRRVHRPNVFLEQPWVWASGFNFWGGKND